MKPTLLIIGFGSPLMADDAVGPRAIAMLRAMGLPACAVAHDGGVSALDALPDLEGKRLVLIVDAVRGGGAPGTIYRIPLHELRSAARPLMSLHSLNVLDAARLWELQLAELPEIVIYGVEPETTDLGLSLSPAVEHALPKLCHLILENAREFAKKIDTAY